MIHVGGVALVHPVELARHRGVHVAVEEQAVAAARARQRAHHVEALGEQAHLARLEAFFPQPLVDVLGDRRLVADGAVDVADLEREIDQLLAIDPRDDFVDDRHGFTVYTVRASLPRPARIRA